VELYDLAKEVKLLKLFFRGSYGVGTALF